MGERGRLVARRDVQPVTARTARHCESMNTLHVAGVFVQDFGFYTASSLGVV